MLQNSSEFLNIKPLAFIIETFKLHMYVLNIIKHTFPDTKNKRKFFGTYICKGIYLLEGYYFLAADTYAK